ncbi:MAG TPA: tripartite tricarboxylate transporter substrate binding protein [Xanthobacteraceae bacterium]|nr:tripartite tricarboxylate transporter substrate binding protein [Xanthobacteraceae bacterium]
MQTVVRLLVAACLALASAAAQAQPYPNRPITLIVPFGAGSGTDAVSRIVAQHLSVALKQNIVVENRPGGNGAIAATYVARSAPDGYTLFMSTNSPHSAAPFLMKNIGYDPIRDFAPLSRVGSFTLMLVVHPDVPVKSVPELVAYARENPGKLSFASGNTSGIVAGETLKAWAGINILHVPYKSVPQALTDVLAGRVSMMFTDLTPGLPHVRSGALRALAITRKARSRLLPDVPSLHEAGITDFEVDSWAGLFAPANTPPEILTQLNTEVRKIIDDPEVKAQIARIGFEAFSSTPEELGEFVKVQLGKWSKMIKDAGIEPE